MRPSARWMPSPNFKAVQKRRIACVVIHATATKGLQGPIEWLCSPISKVSAHYLIGLEGTLIQMVSEKNIAWHAGESCWKGKEGVNTFSVGIELVNPNDGIFPYPEVQLAQAVALCREICRDYNIKAEDVVGHADIAPGRKTDPANFPWVEFRARLREQGVA